MNKFKVIVMLVFVSAMLFVAYTIKIKSDEEKLDTCINGILSSININTLEFDVNGRLNSPIISGKLTSLQKKQLIDELSQKCKLHSFEDLISIEDESNIKISHINFKLDGVNKIASITGMVNSSIEQKDILSSFTEAVNKYYGPWIIHHEILVYKEVERNEFAIDINLVFSAISLIKVTDITFINDQLIVKGLVRNISDKHQTLEKLNQLFQDDLDIIDELQHVANVDEDNNDLEFKIEPIKLEPIQLEPIEFSKKVPD